MGVILDPRGATRVQDLGGHRRAVERPARTRLEAVRTMVPGGDYRDHCAFVVKATHRGVREVQDLGDLLGDGGEHFCR